MTTVHENIMHSQNYQSSMIPGLGLGLDRISLNSKFMNTDNFVVIAKVNGVFLRISVSTLH